MKKAMRATEGGMTDEESNAGNEEGSITDEENDATDEQGGMTDEESNQEGSTPWKSDD